MTTWPWALIAGAGVVGAAILAADNPATALAVAPIDLGPAVAAIFATSIPLVGGWLLGRRTAKAPGVTAASGAPAATDQVASGLRDLLAIAEAKVQLLQDDVASRDGTIRSLTDQLGMARGSLDDCARQRDDAWSELRQIGRRRPSRERQAGAGQGDRPTERGAP